ncbi:hypothetical protein IWX75_001224 [Arthrobacter sp. CAN_A6]
MHCETPYFQSRRWQCGVLFCPLDTLQVPEPSEVRRPKRLELCVATALLVTSAVAGSPLAGSSTGSSSRVEMAAARRRISPSCSSNRVRLPAPRALHRLYMLTSQKSSRPRAVPVGSAEDSSTGYSCPWLTAEPCFVLYANSRRSHPLSDHRSGGPEAPSHVDRRSPNLSTGNPHIRVAVVTSLLMPWLTPMVKRAWQGTQIHQLQGGLNQTSSTLQNRPTGRHGRSTSQK